jgi:death-on-curing protein
MITIDIVERIHEIVLREFGGGSGIRHMAGLQAAIARPYATFGEIDLYPSGVEKAAAILESILINRPFIDGNKRTGYVLMRLILLEEDLDIFVSEDKKYDMVIAVSKGELRFDGIKEWLFKNTK